MSDYHSTKKEPLFSEETIEKIANHILGGLFVANREGVIVYCNDSCLDMFACSRDAFLSSTYSDDHPCSGSALAECLQSKQVVIQFLRTGTGAAVMLHCQPVLTAHGELELVVASVHSEDTSAAINMRQEAPLGTPNGRSSSRRGEFLLESNNEKMQAIYAMIQNIARTNSGVILYGESGVGKEIIARAIHDQSRRRHAVFLPVNCASIPHELIESELFGYEKGSFTGAKSAGKAGLFEAANNGTIFLDEIGEFPLPAQAKLLRVLESGAIRRIGGEQEVHLDVRIVAATNRDLKSMVEEGAFREDLYYRLNVIPLHIPPLRERQEDIMDFANFYLDLYNGKYQCNRFFSPKVTQKLMGYAWPGNIRELRNIIERMVIVSEEDKIAPTTVFFSAEQAPSPSASYDSPLKEAMTQFERGYILNALERDGGNISMAAKRIGIHRTNLYKAIKRLDIQLPLC